jgi:hypothetical protein
MIDFPLRPAAHQLEEISRRVFTASLPKGWTYERVDNDYGIDGRVEMFEDGRATGHELLVQLKSSARASPGRTEDVTLKVTTYNLMWNKLQVAMLVKYVETENEGYWMFLRDVPSPDQDLTTFTIHIPRENRLSDIRWPDVQARVRDVTDRKLAAQRAHDLNGGR